MELLIEYVGLATLQIQTVKALIELRENSARLY